MLNNSQRILPLFSHVVRNVYLDFETETDQHRSYSVNCEMNDDIEYQYLLSFGSSNCLQNSSYNARCSACMMILTISGCFRTVNCNLIAFTIDFTTISGEQAWPPQPIAGHAIEVNWCRITCKITVEIKSANDCRSSSSSSVGLQLRNSIFLQGKFPGTVEIDRSLELFVYAFVYSV